MQVAQFREPLSAAFARSARSIRVPFWTRLRQNVTIGNERLTAVSKSHPTTHNDAIRSSWLSDVSVQCEGFVSESPILVIERLSSSAAQFIDRLPPPHTSFEQRLFRALLLDVAARIGHIVHDAFHRHEHARDKAHRHCEFTPAATLAEWVDDPTHSPSETFRRWAVRFAADFEDAHVLACAERAEQHIQRHFRGRIGVEVLARHLRCGLKPLRRSFKALTGFTIREYQAELRLREALRLLEQSDLKIEAIAHEVGYRSKKGLYQVVHERVGLTPLDFRKHCRNGRWRAPSVR